MRRLLGFSIIVILLAMTAGCGREPAPRFAATSAADFPRAEPARDPGLEIFRAWQQARERAWTAGDARALLRLYATGAGQQDSRQLRRYLRRGLTVERVREQVLGYEEYARTPRRLLARVTSRTLPVEVTDSGGRRWTLPASAARARRVELRRSPRGWVMVRVRAVRPPAPAG